MRATARQGLAEQIDKATDHELKEQQWLRATADADEDLQATLQHVVATYDPVNGRRIYVNGVFADAHPRDRKICDDRCDALCAF